LLTSRRIAPKITSPEIALQHCHHGTLDLQERPRAVQLHGQAVAERLQIRMGQVGFANAMNSSF
jgi:hypothetical protein